MLIVVVIAILVSFLSIGGMIVRPAGAIAGPQLWRWMFSAMVVGLSVFHGLGLLRLPITATVIITASQGLLGTFFLLHRLYGFTISRSRVLFATSILIGLALIGLQIMKDPLEGADARSIWFFHARMIYVNDGLNAAADWKESSIAFSHPDYPKLVPYLAASIATIFGFWNDFLPKLSLVCLFTICLVGFFRFYENSLRFWCTIFLCLLTPEPLLWNGFMDGYLAIAVCLGLFYWSQYLETQEAEDFLAGYLAFALAAQLKNEGSVIFLCALSILMFFCRRAIWQLSVGRFLPLLIGVLPVFQWTILRHTWGVTNDLHLGFSSLERFVARLELGTFSTILQSLRSPLPSIFIVVLLAPVLLTFLRPVGHYQRAIWFLILFVASYSLLLFAVYFTTPHLLSWHVGTSIDRTTLPITMAGFVLLFRFWSQLISATRATEIVELAKD